MYMYMCILLYYAQDIFRKRERERERERVHVQHVYVYMGIPQRQQSLDIQQLIFMSGNMLYRHNSLHLLTIVHHVWIFAESPFLMIEHVENYFPF